MFSDCASSCGITCENAHLPPDQQPVCDAVCIEGCTCPPGLIPLSSDPKETVCVPPDQCPRPVCPPTQVYRDCATSFCGITCLNYHFPPILQPLCSIFGQCVPGCSCEDGLIPLGQGSRCVAPSDCPTAFCSLPPETGPCRYVYVYAHSRKHVLRCRAWCSIQVK